MTREPPDVVTERGLRKLVGQGWHLVLVAYEDAQFRSQHWSGSWGVRVARPDGAAEHVLVVSRAPNDERRFTTINPVFSLLDKYGVAVVHVPLHAGGRAVNIPSTRWVPD